MLRNTFFAVLTVVVVAATSQAATIVEIDAGVDTPGLAGFKTFTLTAVSDAPISAVNFAGDGSNDPATGLGFFGPLNQINPFGFPTIFNDSNAAITATGGDPRQDSQFMVNSTTVVVPPGLAEEGPNILQAAWAWSAPQGMSVPFAQLVIPTASTASVNFRGQFTVFRNGGNVDEPMSAGVVGGEITNLPPVAANTDLGNTALAIINHLFSATDDAGQSGLTWSNLQVTAGSPSVAPTLGANGQFTWHTQGSARPGVYTFQATVTDAGTPGLTDVGTLTLNLIVPEPATMTMLGLAMIGLVGFGARKRS